MASSGACRRVCCVRWSTFESQHYQLHWRPAYLFPLLNCCRALAMVLPGLPVRTRFSPPTNVTPRKHTMKKTDLAKNDAKKLMNQMDARGKQFGASAAVLIDKREQRERDRALGLVPFAVKLNGDLVQQLQKLAQERELDMNQVVADVIRAGLAK
jgi:hypothetical protein